jgi:uncharacterized protein DUF4382
MARVPLRRQPDLGKGTSLMTAVRARLTRRLMWTSCALALGVTALLAGCSSSTNVTYGTAVVSLSDVSGDFSSYVVNIDSIVLTRSDGVLAEPLATPEAVDLVRLKDLTELVEAPAVPVGTYTSLALTLDFTNPFITVNIDGQVTRVSPVDSTGSAIFTSTVSVTFDPSNPLVITAGQCTRLAIEINLAAFNTINFGTSPLTITVKPFLTATVAPVDTTLMRARGTLVIAQPGSNDYVVNMRPFGDPVSALGALTVNTTASTYFNVNGVAYTGTAGLTALQSLQVSSPVAAVGTLGSLASITPTFNATEVYAGSSLESPLADYVTGIVAARSGDALTIQGGSYRSRIGFISYLNSLTVTLGPSTIVSEDGALLSGLSPQSVSVGQLINVSGQGSSDASGNVTLDATSGQVRLAQTPIWGTLNSAAAGSMSLDLLSLGQFEPTVFNFAGTGAAAANDAVPTSYAVNTGALDESGVAGGTLLETFGIVSPFGSAPPDFTATAVTPGSATTQELVVEWENGGSANPFSSASSSGLVVNLSDPNLSSTIRYISIGPTRQDLTTLPASPTIVFASGTPLTLALGNAVALKVFNSAGSFAASLASTLNGSNLVYRLVCVGQYASATNTFTASQVDVNF